MNLRKGCIPEEQKGGINRQLGCTTWQRTLHRGNAPQDRSKIVDRPFRQFEQGEGTVRITRSAEQRGGTKRLASSEGRHLKRVEGEMHNIICPAVGRWSLLRT